MKKGLVLEGGGMRGLFSEGFIDVMQEAGITVDGIIGVSAGALFGCNFKSHQVGRGLRYNVRFKDDPRYMGWRSFLTTGNFVNAQFAYHTMPMELDVFDIPAFEADPTEFYLACTDIKTGKPVYQQIVSSYWFYAHCLHTCGNRRHETVGWRIGGLHPPTAFSGNRLRAQHRHPHQT